MAIMVGHNRSTAILILESWSLNFLQNALFELETLNTVLSVSRFEGVSNSNTTGTCAVINCNPRESPNQCGRLGRPASVLQNVSPTTRRGRVSTQFILIFLIHIMLASVRYQSNCPSFYNY